MDYVTFPHSKFYFACVYKQMAHILTAGLEAAQNQALGSAKY